jgi:hypothetical protein
MMSRSHFAAPVLVLLWLTAQLWVYFPIYSSVADVAFITKLMVEEIAILACWISAWSWVTWQEQGHTRIAEHTIIAAGASFFDAAVLNYALPWIFFNVGWPWPTDTHNIPNTALITLTALVHLHIASRIGLNLRLFTLWVAGSVLAMTLVTAHTWATKNDQAAADKLPYSPNIYAPTFVVTPEHKLREGLEHMWSKSWSDQ